MKNEKPDQDPGFEEQATKAIKDLQSAHKRNLNRQLAFEAMMVAMLARVQPQALPGLLEEYEAACDRLAANLRPQMQEPELWLQWSNAITERMRSLAPAPPGKTDKD